MTHEETSSLLDRARAGDRGAFDELCREHRRPLESLVRSWMGTALRGKVEPEDILQEALLRAFESIGVFRGSDGRTFFNWLASIAEHLVWNASQKRSLRQASLTFDVAGPGVSPSQGLRREERLERLERSLSTLKPEARQAIILSKIDGLTLKEIAERLRCSEEAAKKLVARGLRELRRKFGETESLHLPDRALGEGGIHGAK